MATHGFVCLVKVSPLLPLLLGLLLLSPPATLAQNEAELPGSVSGNAASNQNWAASNPNLAANETLCLSERAVDISRQLFDRFQDNANGGGLTEDGFRRLLAGFNANLGNHKGLGFEKQCAENSSLIFELQGVTFNCPQVLGKCPSIAAIYATHSGPESLSPSHLAAALQEAAFSLTDPLCVNVKKHRVHRKPSTVQAWGYGIGFVTLVCIISNVGGLLTPFMSRAFFQALLQFLVAMGAGTLAATGLLVLIPEAFDIVSLEELGDDYVWKGATALISIFTFFISERLLKFFLRSKELKAIKRDMSSEFPSPDDESKTNLTLENGHSEEHGHSHFVTPPPSSSSAPSKGRRRGPVATVAWMVLIGDVIHNFVDGMAIGAAFTENVYLGVSIGIAVLCEELPHELGDVAILLHSGMSMKRALVLNFLSACVCYIGLILGIVLGENTEATRWILAMAGGLFLYVPLVDMLPDMSQHLDSKMRESQTKQGSRKTVSREVWMTLLVQALGLMVGICIIITVSTFAGQIEAFIN